MFIEKEIAAPDLEQHGIRHVNAVYANLGTAQLVEHALERHEGHLAANGALVVRTGQFTGRSPKDKFIVRDEGTGPSVQWGAVNQPMSDLHFERLFPAPYEFLARAGRVRAGLPGRGERGIRCRGAGGEPTARGTACSRASCSSAGTRARTGAPVERRRLRFCSRPNSRPTRRRKAPIRRPASRSISSGGWWRIVGTSYAGEMKKSAFTILNYLLPERGVFPMHCSANVGAADDVALFFGLSGTGKTTLSADPGAAADRRRRAWLERARGI